MLNTRCFKVISEMSKRLLDHEEIPEEKDNYEGMGEGWNSIKRS